MPAAIARLAAAGWMAPSRPPLRGLRIEIKAYVKLYGRVVAELAGGTAMADLRSVIGLLYRADWTRLSMSAGVRFASDRDLALSRLRGPPFPDLAVTATPRTSIGHPPRLRDGFFDRLEVIVDARTRHLALSGGAAVMPGTTGYAVRTAVGAVRRTAGAVSATRSFLDDLRGRSRR